MFESPVVIALLVVFLLLLAGGVTWLILLRRPTKFDPRRERLVQNVNQLYRDDPRRAMDVISRALVRGGLLWETDMQSVKVREPVVSPRTPARDQAGGQQRTGRSDQQPDVAAQTARPDNRARRPPGKRQDDVRQPSSQQPAPAAEPAQKPPTSAGKGAPEDASGGGPPKHRPRRRRRRPAAPRKGQGESGSSPSSDTSS